MKTNSGRTGRRWLDAELFSPKDFVRHAVLISLVFGILHLCGLREFTSILNGTAGSMALSWETSAVLGVIYIFFYLALVLLVPALLLAALLLVIARKIFPKVRA